MGIQSENEEIQIKFMKKSKKSSRETNENRLASGLGQFDLIEPRRQKTIG
jgi:hypothetical protein